MNNEVNIITNIKVFILIINCLKENVLSLLQLQ